MTRERIQDLALVALVVFSVFAAFLAAANAFQVSAYIGTAIVCLAVLTGMALIRKKPRTWRPRVTSNSARNAVYGLMAVTVVLYILGLVL